MPPVTTPAPDPFIVTPFPPRDAGWPTRANRWVQLTLAEDDPELMERATRLAQFQGGRPLP